MKKGMGLDIALLIKKVGNIRLQTLFLQQVVREKREILYINLKTVSYTHLDVYKRQKNSCSPLYESLLAEMPLPIESI